MYWAGSDQDGAIAGFYYAVVETLPEPPEDATVVPPLPGPKPQDYHFTTRTDSVFTFRVAENHDDRQHAFFIYAVDNQGKADATPARIIFNALDKFRPLPVIEFNAGARATGRIYRVLRGGLVVSRDTTVFMNDSLTLRNLNFDPRDTVPASARLDFTWRGEPRIAGTFVTGFRYKLDESQFNVVDGSVTSASYNTGIGADRLQPGPKVFTLRVVDEASGATEINRRFQLNYSPDSWFSGPDTTLYPRDPLTGDRFVTVPNTATWLNLPPLPGSLMSCDSLRLWPAERPQRKSFLEIYTNKIYIRSENDTVDMNSWVIVHAGGSDLDSPYDVRVKLNDPAIPDTGRCTGAHVLRPSGPNGSPIGTHHQYLISQDFAVSSGGPSQTGLYPLFDGASAFRRPTIGGYEAFLQSGKVYMVVRSEDGNGAQDRRITNAKQLADKVDRGEGTPEEVALRSRVLTFYVNKSPRLTFAGGFFPRPNDSVFTTHLQFNLLADDADPYNPNNRPLNVGGPSLLLGQPDKVLRYTVTVKGQDINGATVIAQTTPPGPGFSGQVVVDLPPNMVSVQDTVLVQLCDCIACELTPGQGRCVNYAIPIRVLAPPAPGIEAPSMIENRRPPRPGERRAANRSVAP